MVQQSMRVSVSEAKARLTELVRNAAAGEEVILTRHGQGVVRLAPLQPVPSRSARLALLESVRRSGAARLAAGEVAAMAEEFLYDEQGMPG